MSFKHGRSMFFVVPSRRRVVVRWRSRLGFILVTLWLVEAGVEGADALAAAQIEAADNMTDRLDALKDRKSVV